MIATEAPDLIFVILLPMVLLAAGCAIGFGIFAATRPRHAQSGKRENS